MQFPDHLPHQRLLQGALMNSNFTFIPSSVIAMSLALSLSRHCDEPSRKARRGSPPTSEAGLPIGGQAICQLFAS